MASLASTLRVRTAEALAEALNNARIPYAIGNGLYGYPSSVGRDVDVLLGREDVDHALRICDQLKRQLCWDHVLVRHSPYDLWQVFFIKLEETELTWLQVDFLQEGAMLIGAAPLAKDFASLLRSPDLAVGPFCVSRIAHYLKSQLRPILYRDTDRFASKYSLEPVESPELVLHLQQLFGPRLARRFISATRSGVRDLRAFSSCLRWNMNIRYVLRHPLRASRNFFQTRILRPVRLYRDSSEFLLACTSPCTADAIAEVRQYLNGCFDIRIAKQSSSPHAGIARRIADHWLQDRFISRCGIEFLVYDAHCPSLCSFAKRVLSAGIPVRHEFPIGAHAHTNGVSLGRSLAEAMMKHLAQRWTVEAVVR